MNTEDNTPDLLSLTEISDRLHMKKPNTKKFLYRHGLKPAARKAQGHMWWASDIERIKAEREADPKARAADEKRRIAALRNANGATPREGRSLGPSERRVLETLAARSRLEGESDRHAARRLVQRGLVVRVKDELQTYHLTDAGEKEFAKQESPTP